MKIMILQTQTKMLTLLMALDCQRNEKRFLDSVSDAIMIARANPNVPQIVKPPAMTGRAFQDNC